jgi:sphinganine-1-phosphate aldolase
MIGKDNYEKYAMEIQENLNFIKKYTCSIQGISIIGNPNINVIAYKSSSKEINIYTVLDKMKKKEWELTIMQNPPAFHLCLTKLHSRDICQQFCDDLSNVIKEIVENPVKEELGGTLALYGSSEKIENSLFIDEIVHDFIFLLSAEKSLNRYQEKKF